MFQVCTTTSYYDHDGPTLSSGSLYSHLPSSTPTLHHTSHHASESHGNYAATVQNVMSSQSIQVPTHPICSAVPSQLFQLQLHLPLQVVAPLALVARGSEVH